MERNIFAEDDWVLKSVVDLSICKSFDCGDDDLNEYFHVDVIWHKEELLTQTYWLHERRAPTLVLALLDFCNDAVQLKKVQYPLDLDQRIHYPFIPAVKLTRLGVAKQFQGNNIGTHALNMVKKLFTTDNRTGCRFITVDAYNHPRVIKFYAQNGFNPFTEKDKDRNTRSLFFDLKRFKFK
jgi:GNAT superfamily N-acetyltransferase